MIFDNQVDINKINEIGLKVQEKFREILYEEINEEYLRSILSYLDSYWFDRDRSAVIWYCNRIVGGTPEKTITPSLIISLTSAGLGIHDDIIDKTKKKHSKKTIPEIYKLEPALVTGNILLTKGLTCIGLLYEEFDNSVCSSMIDALKSYYNEMAIGEIQEIKANKNINLDLPSYQNMLWKLSTDGEVCAKLGAISGNGSEAQIGALAYYGKSLSYLKRTIDELKDVFTVEKLKSRIENESIPLALIYAVKMSKKNYKKINDILLKENIEQKDFISLKEICYNKNFIKYVYDQIDAVYNNTIEKMATFPHSEAKSTLIDIININISLANIK